MQFASTLGTNLGFQCAGVVPDMPAWDTLHRMAPLLFHWVQSQLAQLGAWTSRILESESWQPISPSRLLSRSVPPSSSLRCPPLLVFGLIACHDMGKGGTKPHVCLVSSPVSSGLSDAMTCMRNASAFRAACGLTACPSACPALCSSVSSVDVQQRVHPGSL